MPESFIEKIHDIALTFKFVSLVECKKLKLKKDWIESHVMDIASEVWNNADRDFWTKDDVRLAIQHIARKTKLFEMLAENR